MKDKDQIKVGDEVVMENGRWVMVEEVTEDGSFIVVDEDGQDFELRRNQIDKL